MATRANEKLLAQRIFQVADLCADSWGSQQQLLRSIGDAPAPGYLPEVQKVVVVEPFHGASIIVSKTLRVTIKFSTFPNEDCTHQ